MQQIRLPRLVGINRTVIVVTAFAPIDFQLKIGVKMWEKFAVTEKLDLKVLCFLSTVTVVILFSTFSK